MTQPTTAAGTRLVLVSEELAEMLEGRTLDGDRLTVEWGEPDNGLWTPAITRHTDDNLAAKVRADLIERVEGLPTVVAPHPMARGDNEGWDERTVVAVDRAAVLALLQDNKEAGGGE